MSVCSAFAIAQFQHARYDIITTLFDRTFFRAKRSYTKIRATRISKHVIELLSTIVGENLSINQKELELAVKIEKENEYLYRIGSTLIR